ncbi:hypothetical protein [Sphingomonas morindae]|uniref:Uncharacterized protein n=1 Tax=Sphingomonas morindae TaxID=1541170 RepID=A0ABY4X815_9SPHN|nr:hypothetical protein [Sphingomonas morindae]USI73094.1 hypothetical protein LHA26_01025 [Sphingomonas morindae]
MKRRTCAILALALLLGGSSAIAAAPKAGPSYATGRFEVAGQLVPPAQVLDARALPDMAGKPSLMVTLAPALAEALARGKPAATPIAATLDGKPLGASPAGGLAADHMLQLSGAFGSYESAAALARRISGKDPLPDSEGD